MNLTSRGLPDLKELRKKFMEAHLDKGHIEQLGQLSNITAGRLISLAQFFTPYFINKKAV